VGVPKKPTGFFLGYVPGCLNPASVLIAGSVKLMINCIVNQLKIFVD